MNPHRHVLSAALWFICCVGAAPAFADEGMWLFNAFPTDAVKKSHGVTLDQKWLDRVRLGAVRLANGCSASLVSAQGLILTNHHCIRSCLEDLSTPQRDLLTQPFVATTRAQEERCPGVEGNQLVRITDVTAGMLAATAGTTGAEYTQKVRAEQSRVEGACSGGDVKKRCDLVTLFNGAAFHLYEYRRFQDLRVVFAPEFDMAAFGGDPDNFNFPRYGSDMALLRVWDGDKPLATPEHLRFSRTPVREGDVVMVAGHPGGTQRSKTVAELEFQRDVALPWTLLRLAELRGRLDVWMAGNDERRRVARSRLRTVENGLKALRGRHQALGALGFMEQKRTAETALRAKAPAATQGAWDDVARAMAAHRPLWAEHRMLEGGEAFMGDLFAYARMLVRTADEARKPDAERLPEYMPARLPFIRQQLTGKVPVHKDLEKAVLTWSLQRLRNLLGADAPLVRQVLGQQSPEALAAQLVDGTQLHDAAFRVAVLEGREPADKDVMLAFARRVDAASRAVRSAVENNVDAVVKKANEQLAEARRVVNGTQGYPDATFTLRLSYGHVRGYADVPAATTVGGFFGRLTGVWPFAAAPSWTAARATLPDATPFNVATTNDIIGGNSGSPLLNRDGDVVGLVFDGNLQSLAGDLVYDGAENRTVAVHGDLILMALEKVYGAQHLVKELRPDIKR